MRATSSYDRRGSNCSDVQDDSEDKSPTFFAWPTMLRKVRRSVCSMFQHHSHLVARLGSSSEWVWAARTGRF